MGTMSRDKKEDKKTKGKKKEDKKEDKKTKGVALKVVGDVVPATGDEPYADLRKEILHLKDSIDKARWRMAEMFFQVHDESIFYRWGYTSWEQYVDSEIGMTVRTAQYLTAMYSWFVVEIGSQMSDEAREAMIGGVRELGWTKARCLVGVAGVDDVSDWIKKAKDMSCDDLTVATKKVLTERQGGDPGEVETMKSFSCRVAEEQLTIIVQALETAGIVLESDKRGHALSMICQDYVANNAAQSDEGQKARGRYFDKIGAQFGVRLIAVDKETKQLKKIED
jgi:hypothetical protein